MPGGSTRLALPIPFRQSGPAVRPHIDAVPPSLRCHFHRWHEAMPISIFFLCITPAMSCVMPAAATRIAGTIAAFYLIRCLSTVAQVEDRTHHSLQGICAMKNFLLTLVAVSSLSLGGLFASTASAHGGYGGYGGGYYPQPCYRPVYSPPCYTPPCYRPPCYTPPCYQPPCYTPPCYRPW